MNTGKLVADELLVQKDKPVLKAIECILSFGVTARALAKQINCNEVTLCNWRSGQLNISEKWEERIFELLGECVASKSQTVKILKSKGVWNAQMRSMVNQRFAHATKLYAARPQRLRDDSQNAA